MVLAGPPVEAGLLPRQDARTVVSGSMASCAVTTDGDVYCWGTTPTLSNGQEVDGSPLPVPAAYSNPKQLVLGAIQACVLSQRGHVLCWDHRPGVFFGPDEIGTSVHAVPLPIEDLAGVTQIAAGDLHVCALQGGLLSCWGRNLFGQFGNGSTSREITYAPTQVPGLSNVVEVSGGDYNTCALIADGTVWCWGENQFGTVGDGTTTDRLTPVPVTGLTGAIEVEVAFDGACALLADRTVTCWGNIGHQRPLPQTTPTAVPGLAGVRELEGGGSHMCAVLLDDTARCWGDNQHGQLGNGTVVGSSTPTPVVGLSRIRSLSLGAMHSCASRTDGAVYCWGDNAYGQLGDGTGLWSLSGAVLPFPPAQPYPKRVVGF